MFLISKRLNVYTEAKNGSHHTTFHTLHIDVDDRGVAVAIYKKLQVCLMCLVGNLTMTCLYLRALIILNMLK